MKKLLIFIATLMLLSCGSYNLSHYKIRKSPNETVWSKQSRKVHNKTYRIARRFYICNENAFCALPDYGNLGYVWTYRGNKIIIYRLVGGKIKEKKQFQRQNFIDYLQKSDIDSLKSLLNQPDRKKGNLWCTVDVYINKNKKLQNWFIGLAGKDPLRFSGYQLFDSIATDMRRYKIWFDDDAFDYDSLE